MKHFLLGETAKRWRELWRKSADLRATTRPRDACGRSPSWIRVTPSLSTRSRFTIPTGLDAQEHDDDGSENEQHREPF